MGESQQEQLSLGPDARVHPEFVGSRINSYAGLGPCLLSIFRAVLGPPERHE